MKRDLEIADVRVTLLRMPYVEMPRWMAGYDREREILLVDIETRAGQVGLGYQLYLRSGFRTVAACIEENVTPVVLGRHATEVEGIWHDFYHGNSADGRGGASEAPGHGLRVKPEIVRDCASC